MGIVALFIAALFSLISVFGPDAKSDETFFISLFFIGISLICLTIEGK